MKLTISKNVYDENVEEQISLIINGIAVGSYSSRIYSKWYFKRLDKGEHTIPNVGKFVSGLIMKNYGIDTRDWNNCNADNNSLENILQKMNCSSIGAWFEAYMAQEIEN